MPHPLAFTFWTEGFRRESKEIEKREPLSLVDELKNPASRVSKIHFCKQAYSLRRNGPLFEKQLRENVYAYH